MLRYYRRGRRTRTAETRTTAQRLTRHGWRRCTPAQHRAAWQARDALRRLEGDIPPPGWVEGQVEAVPEVRRDVVYPSSWRGER